MYVVHRAIQVCIHDVVLKRVYIHIYAYIFTRVYSCIYLCLYVAPEVLLSSESSSGYGLSADIYSLGVLAWELFADSGSDNPLKGLDSSLAWAKVGV